jgi:hypothetical protein
MTSATDNAEKSEGRNAPRRLLWTTGAIFVAFGIAAFWLWGMNGEAWILDLIAAYCG